MIKLNPKFKNFVAHKGRYVICSGGRGSSKSFTISAILIMMTFTAGHKIIMARLTMASSANSTIAEVNSMIEKMGLSNQFDITKNEIINRQTKSSIIFMGLRANNKDNSARLKSIANITVLCIEEAEELTDENLFDKINLSIRPNHLPAKVILILNPATKQHFIYERWFQKKMVAEGFNGIVGDTCYIHSTYKDNIKNLPQDFLDEFESMKINHPDKYKHIVLGGWLEKSEGVIFTDWEFGKFPDNVDSFFGADWGYSIDPSTLVECYIDKKQRTIYLKEHLYKKGMNTSELTSVFSKAAGEKTIIGDYSEGRLIDEMKSNGINIRKCRKGAGSIKEGILLMKDYKMIVEGDNLGNELNNYSWKTDDIPIDKFNHAIDAARYAISDKLKDADGIYYFY